MGITITLTIIILSIALIWMILKYYSEVGKRIKLQRKNKALIIPYDDYARYQKAYVQFYKTLMKAKLNVPKVHTHLIVFLIKIYEEIFENENN